MASLFQRYKKIFEQEEWVLVRLRQYMFGSWIHPFFRMQVGDVKRIVLATDKNTQKSRGFAFVEFPVSIMAEECIKKCNGVKLNDKEISVSAYSEKKEAPEKKPKKEKKERKEPRDPFDVDDSSSDEDDDDDKPDKDGIFPNRVLVVARLAKNLSWEKTMESLQSKFSKIGKVSNIRMPKQGSSHKGYAFVEFRKAKHAKRALEWAKKNTKMSVSWKMDRDKYVKKKQDAFIKKKEDEFEEEQERYQKHLKKYTEDEDGDSEKEDLEEPEEYFGEEKEEENKEKTLDELLEEDDEDKDDDKMEENEEGVNSDMEDDNFDMGEDAEQEEDEPAEDEDEESQTKRKYQNTQTEADLKKTVFVQNLPYNAGVDEIKEIFESRYGPVAFVAIVAKGDGLSSGRAFVKFKKFSDAKKCIREADMDLANHKEEVASGKKKDFTEPVDKKPGELYIEGRKILVARAIAKKKAEEISKKKEKSDDPRNLALAKIGFIAANSKEAAEMPPEHLKKIQKNWAEKSQKLKNPIYHVSTTRLSIQNMPKTWTEKDLRNLILEKVKYDAVLGNKKPKLIQVKINKEKDTKESKGFGFVEFERHDAALCALEWLNNNPKILNPRVKDNKVASASRLIVEFAVENTMKLAILRRHQNRPKTQHTEGEASKPTTTRKAPVKKENNNMNKRKRRDDKRGGTKKIKK